MGIGQKIRQFGKASAEMLARLLPPEPGTEDLAAAVGYLEYAGNPLGNVVPDFAGQWCLDTTKSRMYRGVANSLPSDWSAPPLPGNAGYRTVLFGDSMTEYNFNVVTPTSVVFDPVTRTITVTVSGGHNLPVGGEFNFWNRSYTSLYSTMRLSVATVVSTTVFTAILPAGTYSDVPASALSGTNYVVPYAFSCAKSWLSWLNALGGRRFNIVHNGAQSGDTTSEALSRLPSVLAYSPALIVMQAPGINDLTYDSLTSRNDVERIISNLKSIFDTIRRAGIPMMVGTITPVASGEARAQKSIMQAVHALNDYIWSYARSYGGIVIVDCYPYIVDPTDTTGLAIAARVNATDKIHFSNIGGYKIAKGNLAKVVAAFPSVRSTLPTSALESRAATALSSPTGVAASNVVTITAASSYIQKGQEVFIRGATGSYAVLNGRQVALASDGSGSFRFRSSSTVPDGSVAGTLVVAPSRQMFPDPLLQTASGGTTSNGVTGTAAGQLLCSNGAGNTGTLTCAASVAAEANGFGNEQLMTITAAALNDNPRISFKNSIGTVENQMTVGRKYQAECQLRLNSTNWAQTPISEIFYELSIGANSGETWRATALNQFENTAPLESSGTDEIILHLKTAPITIPVGTVSLNSAVADCRIKFQAAQSAGTLIMGVSRIAVRDVTEDYSVA